VNFDPGQIISYMDMCVEEEAQLQRGMNFRLRPSHSVLLMSVREGAPYRDQVSDDGQTLIYEGHDVPRSSATPIPKLIDQPITTPSGKLTQNGLFYQAAKKFTAGQQSPETVRVYEKIRKGIWAYAGLFLLTDAWIEQVDARDVCKFRLELILVDDKETGGPAKVAPTRSSSPGRMIPTAVKISVFKRDAGRCVLCNSQDELHFDHILPWSKGGSSTTDENIQLLCARHNLEKSAKIE